MKALSITRNSEAWSAAGGVWAVRLLTLLIWLAVGATAAYWALRAWGSGGAPGELPVATLSALQSDVATMSRALGGAAAPPRSGAQAAAPAEAAPEAGRYRLHGLAVNGRGQGVALIAVDDQPALPYRLSATLPGGARLVALGAGEVVLRLDDPAGQELRLKAAEAASSTSTSTSTTAAP